MEKEPDVYKEWEAYKAAQEELRREQWLLMNNPDFPEMARKLFNGPDTREFLLLFQSPFDGSLTSITQLFFQEIVDTALMGAETNIPLAQCAIKTLDNKWLKTHLYASINEVLAKVEAEEPEENYWAYRRAYGLLGYAGFDEDMADFLERCKVHPDPEVLEIYDDYYPHFSAKQ